VTWKVCRRAFNKIILQQCVCARSKFAGGRTTLLQAMFMMRGTLCFLGSYSPTSSTLHDNQKSLAADAPQKLPRKVFLTALLRV
jgi:hypothetical protein